MPVYSSIRLYPSLLNPCTLVSVYIMHLYQKTGRDAWQINWFMVESVYLCGSDRTPIATNFLEATWSSTGSAFDRRWVSGPTGSSRRSTSRGSSSSRSSSTASSSNSTETSQIRTGSGLGTRRTSVAYFLTSSTTSLFWYSSSRSSSSGSTTSRRSGVAGEFLGLLVIGPTVWLFNSPFG